VALGPPSEIFDEICRGDILLHHPYHSFDTSVLHFLQAAALDERVLAIKLTIYRTSSDSPIITALAEAARRGKQVAVLVEITARFDEAPNIAWGRMLEEEGVHVSYGVEKLKTHVKLAMVVREEGDGVRRYVHVGTGNYHTGTARIYEDFGMLSCDPELSYDVASVFNELTGATQFDGYSQMLVAPRKMRSRFLELIRREAEHAADGRPSGIAAKMNQLQDPEIIRELYRASQAGVPIDLNVRGLCCLRPGVPGLSETIRVFSVLGRFLEHGRIYRFENAGDREYFIGSADWMKRNLDRRVETIAPVNDKGLRQELDEILRVYKEDNHSAWDMAPDGSYTRRRPADGEQPRPSQDVFMSTT
jgi:polyphosphate kinase